jgi:8-oxo-dGTP pyrophosphatase MutT (NUDIX family)
VSLHADALAVLREWVPPDARQAALRERYVSHLEARPDGLERGCHPDHLTASTLVVSADAREVLLTLHAKAGAWFQLGGHCEPGDDTLLGAARREATEESGIGDLWLDPVPLRLDEHAVPFCGDSGEVHHLDVWFLAVAPPGAPHAVSEESLDLRWWPVADLPDPDGTWGEALALARPRLTWGDLVDVAAGRGVELGGGRPAQQVPLGALGLRVALDPAPEGRVVARLEQVGELVDQHVVDHPGRHPLQPGGEPDGAVAGGAGPPAGLLVVDPAHRLGPGEAAEVPVGERPRAGEQLLVGGSPAAFGLLEPGQHRVDPLPLLGAGQGRRDHHHDPVAVAVGRDRTAPALRAPYLDLG